MQVGAVGGQRTGDREDFQRTGERGFRRGVGEPQPCINGSQFTPAARVFIDGQPALLNTSIGIGKSAEQAPQGPAAITLAQTRVLGI